MNWKTLQCFGRSAAGVPRYIRGLLGDSKVREGYYELEETLLRPGQWCEATVPALELLLAGTAGAPSPHEALTTMAELLGAPLVGGWLKSPDGYLPLAVEEFLTSSWARFCDEVSVEDARRRAAAWTVMAMMPSRASEAIRDQVASCLDNDGDSVVRASATLALARHANVKVLRQLEEMVRDAGRSTVERGTAGLGLLRASGLGLEVDEKIVEEGIQKWTLVEGLDLSPRAGRGELGTPLCWFYLGVRNPIAPKDAVNLPAKGAWALSTILTRTESWLNWRERLTAWGTEATDGRTRAFVSTLIYLNELKDMGGAPLRLPDEWEPDRQRYLEQLAATWLCPRAGYGLPAAGAVRRRWFGILPEGLMERNVMAEEAGLTGPTRLGQVCAHWRSTNQRGIPPQLAEAEGRWEGLAWSAVGGYYGSGERIPDEIIQEELRAAANDSHIKAKGRAVLDEITLWCRELRAQGWPGPGWDETPAYLLLPVLAAGIPWQEEWIEVLPDRLGPIWALRVLEKIPEAQRELWLKRHKQPAAVMEKLQPILRANTAHALPAKLDASTACELLSRISPKEREEYLELHKQSPEVLLQVLPLLESPKLPAYYLRTIAKKKSAGALSAPLIALERRIRQLAETESVFAQALRDAEEGTSA